MTQSLNDVQLDNEDPGAFSRRAKKYWEARAAEFEECYLAARQMAEFADAYTVVRQQRALLTRKLKKLRARQRAATPTEEEMFRGRDIVLANENLRVLKGIKRTAARITKAVRTSRKNLIARDPYNP